MTEGFGRVCGITVAPVGKATCTGVQERREKPVGRADPYVGLAVGGYRRAVSAATNSDARHVLVAEDDRGVRESIVRGLRFEGYRVTAVNDGAEAIAAADDDPPDVAVLDVMMPKIDGLAACRALRAGHPDLPILMLTARHEVRDRVAGLDAGADDYLVKPYAMSELAARLRALLRRTSVSGADDRMVVGDLVLDPSARLAWRGDRELTLTKTEFDLLELLLFNAGVVLSRDTIYSQIWGYDFETTSRSLDVYVGYLRAKTEAGGEERVVDTVRGVGYVVRKP